MPSAASMRGDKSYVWATDMYASYRGIWSRHGVLRGITFDGRAGEVTALVGPNGAGKTTLFRVLLGFLVVDRGDCRVGGLKPADYRRTRGIAYVPEFPKFPSAWTGRNVLGRAVDLVTEPVEREEEFARALERAGLESPMLSKDVQKCSNGVQRRLCLACALVGDPDVVILDEPFAGLDPPARIALRREMDSARRRGATVLVSTHNLTEVARSADRVVFLESGRATGTRDLTGRHLVSGAELEEEMFSGR